MAELVFVQLTKRDQAQVEEPRPVRASELERRHPSVVVSDVGVLAAEGYDSRL